MNLNQLYYFKKLAEIQNFTKTAKALYITQPSLSYSIERLEKELNTPLFERKGRNVVLTKYGKIFLEYVNRGLSEIERGIQLVQNYGSPSHGHIDLAFIYNLGHQFLPKLVASFSSVEENKNITFNFVQGTTKEVLKMLKDGKCDIAFSSYLGSEKDLVFKSITAEELVLITAKDHPLAKYNEIDLIEAKDYPFIVYGERSGLCNYIKDMFEKSGFEPIIKCSVEEDHTICGLVESNYGIAIIPKIRTLLSFNLAVIPIKNPKIDRKIYVVYKKSRKLAPAPQKFLDFIFEMYHIDKKDEQIENI